MFKIIYAKSVVKDLKRINRKNLEKIKEEIEELKNFPNISQIKHLTNHPLADYRLRIGNYRVLFNVDWKKKEIHILKIGHRKEVY
ncbi:MAG TPA: type II toxin-antitoxin system RelE/ParE family toxin [Candidatus Desulfofervidus auxilii]|uniref:Type II toxin-antitoxin system RelE/ParE family toxin n=1 Tax=Desulfofervidus auxilii TaxID=1621989 RepID=A0A7C0Y495_DESA2|nr:type II toxin-antitoxin system RelE/ParE family toxin [Candidatus Desulfofervidus auxilii]